MYRKITPERPYLLVASGGEGRMGESYLPHSVQHEKVLTLRKLFLFPFTRRGPSPRFIGAKHSFFFPFLFTRRGPSPEFIGANSFGVKKEKKTVRASRTPTKGQEPGVVQTRQNSGFVRSLVKRVPRVGTVAYISNGVEHASAVQYASQTVTESYEDTSLTRSQGGADRRDGALWRDFTVMFN